MRRMGGWLGAARPGNASSRSMTALDESHALQDAMASAALIMNDEVEQAEHELSKGTSPFHKLGRATALFLRATLGFEKEIMQQASACLAEAEESAAEHQRRAIRDPSTAHQSAIYPAGAEYGLCHAEAQLMSAVVAVLNESLTESLRGFYKLRKAFNSLHEIHEAEKAYLRTHRKTDGSSASSTPTISTLESSTKSGSTLDKSGDMVPNGDKDEDDDLDFVDAEEKPSNQETDVSDLAPQETAPEKLNGSLPAPSQPTGVEADSKSAAAQADQEIDFRTITTDPIDLFIHSGTGMCFGLLQLLLSMVPPAFNRLLSFFSFRGDREVGLRMLWSATRFKHNINGAMAGLATLGYHNGAIAFCDILSEGAMPEARLRSLLQEMRKLYPKSKLWALEEARMLSRDRKLETSVKLMTEGPKSSLKQVEALGLFEMSLNLMYLHRYEECAESFIKCVGINSWSHALYYYIAGACYIELYRLNHSTDPEKAESYATKAEKCLREVPLHAGKKRLMARPLPFDVFVGRKITKWDAKAKARACSFVDAVGVSPVVEMTYFWSGFTRMGPEHLDVALERLAWSEENPHWKDEGADEKAILSLLRGVCYRFQGRMDAAKSLFTTELVPTGVHVLKAWEHADTWPLPVAHYELAVCHWTEAGGEGGDKGGLRKCSEELTKVENWEGFDLDARIGLKLRTARETLKRTDVSRS